MVGRFSFLFLATMTTYSSAFQVLPTIPMTMTSTTRNTSPLVLNMMMDGASVVDISEQAQRDIASMEEWAINCGAQKGPGFQLAESGDAAISGGGNMDVGVLAQEGIAANEVVLYVPNEMILTASAAQQEVASLLSLVGGDNRQLQEAEALLDRLGQAKHLQQFYLFVKILLEYEKGDQSPWFPWLNSLPRYFSNGAAMTRTYIYIIYLLFVFISCCMCPTNISVSLSPFLFILLVAFCYECLPPLVSKLSMEERTRLIHFNQALKSLNLQLQCIATFVNNDVDVAKWAYNIVHTRSFVSETDGERRMVPLADYFNHGSYANVALQYDEQGNAYATTTQDVQAGEPLRMQYSDPTNPSQILATYGFLDESSPATFCKIMHIKKSSELENLGLDFSRMLFYKDSGEIAEEVWDVMLYHVLSKNNNRGDRTTFYNAHMNGDWETKQAVHQQYFVQTASALQKHVNDFLKEVDELLEKGMAKDPNEHPRIPLILAHNEFVRNTFWNVKNNLDPMVEQAKQQSGQMMV